MANSTPPDNTAAAAAATPADAAAANSAASAAKLKDAATARYKEKDYAGALSLYTDALAAAPSSGLYNNRAAAHMMLSQFEEAVADCAAAVKLDDKNTKAYLRGSKAELAQGRLTEAGNLAQMATLKDPFDKDARGDVQLVARAKQRLAAANEALSSREFDKALSLLNLLADTCPASLEVRLKRIEAQIGLRQYEAAAAAAGDLVKLHGTTDPRLLVTRARVMIMQGNAIGATKYLQVGVGASHARCTRDVHGMCARCVAEE